MKCAIYARKSQDQSGVNEEAASVPRQIELARALAQERGWTVDETHIFTDDGIGGAEFEKRLGLVRLLNSLRPKPAFEILVVTDKDRLGREQFEASYNLKQISVAGVRIVEAKNGGREIRLDTPTDKLLISVANFAGELERDKASERTRDALAAKARRGYVTGGTVFGYRNVELIEGRYPPARHPRDHPRGGGGSHPHLRHGRWLPRVQAGRPHPER